MKTTFIIVILTVILFSTFSQTFSTPIKKQIQITQSTSLKDEYVYIGEELWHFVYDDDGSLIFKEKVFE